MKKLVLVWCCLFSVGIIFSQENEIIEKLDSVTVVGKVPLARKDSGKIVAVISPEMIERSKGKTVSQIINEVSGIEINGSRSNEGQNLGYFIRGGRNRQVVVMIDGIQLNDPSSISNDFDLRLIPAESIERIEIIKGASSVMYGSGAATAVISIKTKGASEKPISATFSTFLGSNTSVEKTNKTHSIEEFSSSIFVNGTLNKFFYSARFGNRYVSGLSAVSTPEGEDPNIEDVFNRFDGRVNLGYKISKDIVIGQFFSFDKYKAGFDDFDYSDAENKSISELLKRGGHLEWNYGNGLFVFNDNYSWTTREIESAYPAKYDSKSYTFDAYVNHKFTNNFSVMLGLNFNTSSFNSFSIPFGGTGFQQVVSDDVARANSVDPYISAMYVSDFGLNVNMGARLNEHSTYGSHLVYNVNPSYGVKFGNDIFKVLGSYSTAYIEPSLYQLYDPLYGYEELQPEENRTIEGGLEFISARDLSISAVYFNRIEENFVDFILVDPELYKYQYQNSLETFVASGVEVELSQKFGEKLNISANYTNTQVDERFSLRIPEHKANASFSYQFCEKSFVGLSYQFNGDRQDSFFNSETYENEKITLNSYGVLDFSASAKIMEQLTVFTTVSNLLNEDYEELYRYQTRGRNFRAGLTLSF